MVCRSQPPARRVHGGRELTMPICRAIPLLGALVGALGLFSRTAVAGPAPAPPAGVDLESARVPVRLLLSDGAALQAWLTRRNPELAAARARVDQVEAGVSQSRV